MIRIVHASRVLASFALLSWLLLLGGCQTALRPGGIVEGRTLFTDKDGKVTPINGNMGVLPLTTYLSVNAENEKSKLEKIYPGDVIVFEEFNFIAPTIPPLLGAGPLVERIRIPIRVVKSYKSDSQDVTGGLKSYERSFLFRMLERARGYNFSTTATLNPEIRKALEPEILKAVEAAIQKAVEPDILNGQEPDIQKELENHEVELWNALVQNLYIQRINVPGFKPQIIVMADFTAFKDAYRAAIPEMQANNSRIFPENAQNIAAFWRTTEEKNCKWIDISMYLNNIGPLAKAQFEPNGEQKDGCQNLDSQYYDKGPNYKARRSVEFMVLPSALKMQSMPGLPREEDSWNLWDWSESGACFPLQRQPYNVQSPAQISAIGVRMTTSLGAFSLNSVSLFRIVEPSIQPTHRVVWNKSLHERSIVQASVSGSRSGSGWDGEKTLSRTDLAKLWPSDVDYIRWQSTKPNVFVEPDVFDTTCTQFGM